MGIYMVGAFMTLFIKDSERIRWSFYGQIVIVALFHLTGFVVLLLNGFSLELVLLYAAELFYMILYVIVFRKIYPESSRIILAHMMMFLAISFIILARLDFRKALKQFMFVGVASVLTLVVPAMFSRIRNAVAWGIVTGVLGLTLLIIVLLLSSKTYGANLSLALGPFTFQPSEFVKISFVLLIACMFREKHNFTVVILSGVTALIHIMILVWSTDLGGALLYAFAYLFMLYAATSKPLYLAIGAGGGIGAAYAAYKLFAHVQTRVAIWKDPWPMIYGKGSQVCNSLLGMATGSYFGTGLYQGNPDFIPIVEKDFIFSAIVEEMGTVIGLCIILISIGCFIKFLQVAASLAEPFYRLTGVGLAAIYGLQVILTIGGNIKFIPATGVTLPLVSYGGSSVISTFILFSIMQELFIRRSSETERREAFEKRSTFRTV